MNKKTFLGILRITSLIFVSLVIGINLYMWNSRNLVGDSTPMPFGYGASVVLSGSMEPELSVGDLLILKEADNYQVGDIVVYQSDNMPVVHRIIFTDGDQVQTKGDANPAADEVFSVTAVKGKTILAIPFIGYLVWALKTPLGIILTLGGAIFLVEYSYRSSKKEEDKEVELLKEEIRQLMSELEQEEKE